MEFPPVESTEMLPQVAVTLKKQAVFKAYLVGTDGKQGDSLLINGEGQFVIEAGKAPETSLVVHKEGKLSYSSLQTILISPELIIYKERLVLVTQLSTQSVPCIVLLRRFKKNYGTYPKPQE